jgi:hypothetical protein
MLLMRKEFDVVNVLTSSDEVKDCSQLASTD